MAGGAAADGAGGESKEEDAGRGASWYPPLDGYANILQEKSSSNVANLYRPSAVSDKKSYTQYSGSWKTGLHSLFTRLRKKRA